MTNTPTPGDAIQLTGDWWLPDQPDHKIAGQLRLTPGGRITLSLYGDFTDTEEETGALKPIPFELPKAPNLIIGMATDGKKWQEVTLWQVSLTNKHSTQTSFFFQVGSQILTYCVTVAIVGRHFDTEDTIRFCSVDAYYSYVDLWYGKQPFKLQRKHTKTGKLRSGSITYRHIGSRKYKIKAIGAFLSFGSNLNLNPTPTKISLEHNVPVKLSVRGKKHLRWFMEQHGNLQNLLTLLIGYPLAKHSFAGSVNRIMQGGRKVFETPVQIYYHSSRPWQQTTREERSFLTNFQDIEALFEGCVNTWFSEEGKWGSAQRLLISNLYDPDLPLDLSLLTLTQALEAFQRGLFDGKYISDEDYEPIRQRLVEAVPSEITGVFRESFKGKYKYMHEKSLRTRLKELIKSVQPMVQAYVGERNSFVSTVVDTRNNYTHPDQSLKNDVPDAQERFYINLKLRLLLTALLLQRLGLPQDYIRECFHRFSDFNPLRWARETQQ